MAKLVFDKLDERLFEAGVSEGILFPGTPNGENTGVAWNGLTSVSDSPEGGDANDQYADNIKYLSLRGTEERNGTIEAFMYPPEFEPCLGLAVAKGFAVTGGSKDPFNFVYKTILGNAEDGLDHGEKLHIVYNATVNAPEKTYETINDSPEAMTFSFEYNTTPVNISLTDAERAKLATVSAKFSKLKNTAVIEITKTTENQTLYNNLTEILYGRDASGEGQSAVTELQPTLPLPGTILSMIAATIS